MNALPDILARAVRWLLLAPLLALAACGPGTGGTGTGPIIGVFNFAGSGFSAGAPCTTCGQANLQLDNERVELTISCRRFIHTAPWEIGTDGLAVVNGAFETTEFVDGVAQARSVPAVMHLQFSEARADSQEVAVTVRDANGNDLVAPLTLEQRPAATSPEACALGD